MLIVCEKSKETDVPLVAAACLYVAAKAEETAMHIKVIVTEARATFSGTNVPVHSALHLKRIIVQRIWHHHFPVRHDEASRNGILLVAD